MKGLSEDNPTTGLNDKLSAPDLQYFVHRVFCPCDREALNRSSWKEKPSVVGP